MLAKETSCSFQSFDIFPAKNSANFKLKNWFDVSKKDVSTDGAGRAVVLGFNPPFGKDNIEARKFVVHGIKTFRPRLLVLVVPGLPNPSSSFLPVDPKPPLMSLSLSLSRERALHPIHLSLF